MRTKEDDLLRKGKGNDTWVVTGQPLAFRKEFILEVAFNAYNHPRKRSFRWPYRRGWGQGGERRSASGPPRSPSQEACVGSAHRFSSDCRAGPPASETPQQHFARNS